MEPPCHRKPAGFRPLSVSKKDDAIKQIKRPGELSPDLKIKLSSSPRHLVARVLYQLVVPVDLIAVDRQKIALVFPLAGFAR